MRRAEKEIREPAALTEILARGRVLHLGMCDSGEPYVVPVHYALAGEAIVAHCAGEGRKIGILRRSPRVCFEVTVDEELLPGETPCSWGTRYRSVIGWGRVVFLTDTAEKAAALSAIVRHYSGEPAGVPPDRAWSVAVLRIDIERMTGKASEG